MKLGAPCGRSFSTFRCGSDRAQSIAFAHCGHVDPMKKNQRKAKVTNLSLPYFATAHNPQSHSASGQEAINRDPMQEANNDFHLLDRDHSLSQCGTTYPYLGCT